MSNSAESERQLINGSTALEALSQLSPDSDPGVLLATADELKLIADATKRLYDLGLVRQVQFGVVLDSEQLLIVNVSNQGGN